jgi:hypothetical protein
MLIIMIINLPSKKGENPNSTYTKYLLTGLGG